MLHTKTCEDQMGMLRRARDPLTKINLAVDNLYSMLRGEEEKLYLDLIKKGSEEINFLLNDMLNIQGVGKALGNTISTDELLA